MINRDENLENYELHWGFTMHFFFWIPQGLIKDWVLGNWVGLFLTAYISCNFADAMLSLLNFQVKHIMQSVARKLFW